MFAAFFVSAAIHITPLPPPAAQLAAVEREAPFRVVVLPQSVRLMRADLLRESASPTVRLEYSVEGFVVDIDERVPQTADGTAAPPRDGQVLNLDGYPAFYTEISTGYSRLKSLSWYRNDLTITLTSRDSVSAPLLIDVALELG